MSKTSTKISCKKASEMIEQEAIVPLSFYDKLKLKLHLMICKACQNYKKQSQLIDEFFSNTNNDPETEHFHIEENPHLKETIIKKISETKS